MLVKTTIITILFQSDVINVVTYKMDKKIIIFKKQIKCIMILIMS